MKVSGRILGRRPGSSAAVMFCLIFATFTQSSQATYVCQFNIFTANGAYCNNSGANMYVDLSVFEGKVDFTFHNENSFPSSIARIYFETGPLSGNPAIIDGLGTSFLQDFPGPGNIPAGNTLDTPFNVNLSIGAQAPPSHNGINPSEWISVVFDLPAGETEGTIASEINSGQIRMGVHLIALPDGTSEAAITTPEPATMALLAFGGLSLFRRKKA
jgi:hypothetical protein